MTTEQIIKRAERFLMPTYTRIPLVIEKGQGVRVWDREGKEYLDFISGIGVMEVGHCHPEIVKAIQSQVKELIHCSNLYHIRLQVELAEELCKFSFADRVFFSNSGAEANEAAIKLARKFGSSRGAFEILSMENSFHGRTLGTLGITGQTRYQKGFGPFFASGVRFVPFNDLSQVEQGFSSKTCAVILEPIQGEGGIQVADKSFLQGLRQLCDQKGILLILDEIQCGLGRTGRLFAYEHYGIEPDILTVAKPLGGGFPMGATLAREEVANSFQPGDHASTFGGNPLACAAALAFLRVLIEERLVEKAEERGNYFRQQLEKIKEEFHLVKEVRGKGLMVGMELYSGAREVVKECRERGLLINCTAGETLRFLPPLIVQKEDINRALEILAESLRTVANKI